VRLRRLSPAAVEAVADAALSGKAEAGGAGLDRALRAALARGQLYLGTRMLPLVIADGAIKVGAFSVEAPEGRASNLTTIDLASLKVDSEWRLDPPAKADNLSGVSGRAALPGISVVYVGSLAALHSLEPRIFSDALERELSVRRMERDVDQLERLRRADEARAKAESERLRALGRGTVPSGNPAPRIIEAPLPVPVTPSTGQTAPAQPGTAPQPEAPTVPAPDGSSGAADTFPAPVVKPAPPRRKVEQPVPNDPWQNAYPSGG
jgi:hypothetical protein